MRLANVISILTIILFFSCKKNNFSDEPKISFSRVSANSVFAGTDQNIVFEFTFRDGDGDLGFNDGDTTNNIVFTDNRDSAVLKFKFPEITEDLNPDNGVRGSFEVLLNAAFILKRTDSVHSIQDTVFWNVYVFDQAGNQSNNVQTSAIILK